MIVFAPKVSIVIPVFNGANYLREAIDSALAQTYTNIEVLVINDGSDDDGKTEKIAKSYGEKIRYLYKPNGGVATALNAGIDHAAGDYISWLSHDDLYYPQKIETQIAALAAMPSPDTIIYSDYEMIGPDHALLKAVRLDAPISADLRQTFLRLLFLASVHGCSLLVPKKCFIDVGYFDAALRTTQDYDLWFRMLHRHYEFRHIPEMLIRSRIHSEQGTHSLYGIHHKEAENLYVDAVNMFYDDIARMHAKNIVDLVIDLRNRRLKKASQQLLTLIALRNRPLYKQMYADYGRSLLVSRVKLVIARPLQLMEGSVNLLKNRLRATLKGLVAHAAS